jgi:hypothetical protein
MNNWTKVAATAAAIGALGVAGSYGTFATFTDPGSTKDVSVTSGTIKVSNNFQLPSLQNLGTRKTAWNCDGDTGLPVADGTKQCFAGADQNAGYIEVTNTGSLDQDVYVDFDGPAATDVTSPNAENSNPLASNIIINSSLDPDFSTLGWAGIRLFRINAAGPWKAMTIPAGESKKIYFQAHLRERFPGEYALGDNEMQGKILEGEKVTVSAIEVGRTDLATGADNGA